MDLLKELIENSVSEVIYVEFLDKRRSMFNESVNDVMGTVVSSALAETPEIALWVNSCRMDPE